MNDRGIEGGSHIRHTSESGYGLHTNPELGIPDMQHLPSHDVSMHTLLAGPPPPMRGTLQYLQDGMVG